MLRITLTLTLTLITLIVSAQTSVQTIKATRQAKVNVSDLDPNDDLYPVVTYTGVPDGIQKEASRLAKIKEEVSQRYPRNEQKASSNQLRGGAPPQVLESFQGFTANLGIPMDNHIAVSNDGWVVACANFHIAMYKDNELKDRPSLIAFSRSLSLPALRYDPRAIYDPTLDKFVIVMLHGTSRDQSDIIVGFSETNDPTGSWNLYTIVGNPFDLTIFSDYPMLSLTNDHLYITINAVDDELTWQEGFVETYIWEIDKFQGFAGDSLTPKIITGIQWEGKNIRNICPINQGDEVLNDAPSFLSNRNFDIQNDTIFLIQYENETIEVKPIITDVAYGVPPNADQGLKLLQTNDARILDAFVHEGHVQWVSNTVDTSTGLAVAYHGIIENITTSDVATGKIISDGMNEFGYPDISYVGTVDGDRHSIISMSHVSTDRFPGISTLEYDGTEYSPLLSLKEGDNYINQLGSAVERWGDYSGNQRIYNQPGLCWTVSSFGRSDREYGIWINQLGRSDINVGTKDQNFVETEVYPNPAIDIVDVTFTPPSSSNVAIAIYDMQGKKLMDVVTFKPKKEGEINFSFNVQPLPSGVFNVVGRQNGQVIFTAPIVKK